ncbi:hypothetical protein PENARI_c002G09646 [Penicillium arizonense]|uniref:Uncharacterized protein n=1 Tax=Penicillium arizonense TaxID=1835702 RepID=A0A1F5LVB7_PENAI|nr:hypothetical protein PENARI_c002G09646 [Penicillium arizonense]OGE57103.1 hypothetical protein PENARI_c002G09646 [Penicillium arizonense]
MQYLYPTLSLSLLASLAAAGDIDATTSHPSANKSALQSC